MNNIIVPSALLGGGLFHSGDIESVSRTVFEGNMASEGPAIMSIGNLDYTWNVTFISNTFYCSEGTYGYEMEADKVSLLEYPSVKRCTVAARVSSY